jgi:excisionase family DNA binding protein
MTVHEVAQLLKLNQQPVRSWIDQGIFPAVRLDRRVRIKRSDFDRLVEDGYRGGAPRKAPSVWEGELPDPEASI